MNVYVYLFVILLPFSYQYFISDCIRIFDFNAIVWKLHIKAMAGNIVEFKLTIKPRALIEIGCQLLTILTCRFLS